MLDEKSNRGRERSRAHQEVSQDARGGPEKPVCPTLDAALILVKDKDGATGDHAALSIDESPSNTWDQASAGGLEDEEGILGGVDPSTERRLGPAAGIDVAAALSRLGF